MHPRNIYNKPPDFKSLAAQFPEFRRFVQVELSGQVHFDFKNPDAIRAFSRVLLQKDFNLDVIIPPETLIPTIPLRLNYILWIEDLLSLSDALENVKGLDIGTGASCVYPLLIARKNQWKMIATEKDPSNLKCARDNVERNELTRFIEVKQVTGTTLLHEILSDNSEQFDFCMCNPPFFKDVREINPSHKARKKDRNPPRNAFSCTAVEVVTEGGEVEFITKLIQESITYKEHIKVFSSMVGIKRSLKPLKELLSNTKDVISFKHTEFIQGHTTRWGLAWTFSERNLSETPDYIQDRKKQSPKMFSHTFKTSDIDIGETAKQIQVIFTMLQIRYMTIKSGTSFVVYQISADSNTWSHSRRKRREQKRLESEAHKVKQRGEGNLENRALRQETSGIVSGTEKSENADRPGRVKRPLEQAENEEIEVKRLKVDLEKEKYLEATAHIKLEDGLVFVQLIWLTGSAGKDTLHQILQFIKNHFKINA